MSPSQKPTDLKKVAQEIKALTKELSDHNVRYYQHHAPTISDAEFDQKLTYLKKLERQYPALKQPVSPTEQVGQSVPGQTKLHVIPMKSLNNGFSPQDITHFYQTVLKLAHRQQIAMCCEVKIDGLSLSLVYENYHLVTALTRGDGVAGKNVTANVLTIPELPRTLPWQRAVVHGEIYLSKDTFAELNQVRVKTGEKPFMNARNAAAGTLQVLDPQIAQARHLKFFAYHLYCLQPQVDIPSSQFQRLAVLRQVGFQTAPDTGLCDNGNEVTARINMINQQRNHYNFAIDGVVIKVDNVDWWQKIGVTAKAPRYALAFKFAAATATSLLQKITLHPGRSGKITFVANIKPVMIAGTLVQRASLHNSAFVQTLKLHLGDQVVVKKAGDIIPQLVSNQRSKQSEPEEYQIPTICPVCQTPLALRAGFCFLFCLNRDCPEQQLLRMTYMFSKNCLDVKTLSYQTLKSLFAHQIIATMTDFLTLDQKRKAMVSLPGFGEKKVALVLTALQEARNRGADRLLTGFGIDHVGLQTARLLLRDFGSLPALVQAQEAQLTMIKGIGLQTAQQIVAFWHEPKNRDDLSKFITAGFKTTYPGSRNQMSRIKGLTFVLTGKLERSRADVIRAIEANGGKVRASVSSSTSYVVTNTPDSQTKKMRQAQEYHVKIISEHQLQLLMVN